MTKVKSWRDAMAPGPRYQSPALKAAIAAVEAQRELMLRETPAADLRRGDNSPETTQARDARRLERTRQNTERQRRRQAFLDRVRATMDLPADDAAEQLGTTRWNIYKTRQQVRRQAS